jgi:hypothetical protein
VVVDEFEGGGGRMVTVARWSNGAVAEEYIWARQNSAACPGTSTPETRAGPSVGQGAGHSNDAIPRSSTASPTPDVLPARGVRGVAGRRRGYKKRHVATIAVAVAVAVAVAAGVMSPCRHCAFVVDHYGDQSEQLALLGNDSSLHRAEIWRAVVQSWGRRRSGWAGCCGRDGPA